MNKAKKYLEMVEDGSREIDFEFLQEMFPDLDLWNEVSSEEDDDDDTIELDEIIDAEDVHPAGPGERGGKYGLVHENGTPCDAETPDSCPEEKAQVEADLLGIGQKKRTQDMPSRYTALHDSGYLRVVNKLKLEAYHLREWRKANPGKGDYFYPGNKRISELKTKLVEEANAEKAKWTQEAKRGTKIIRPWWDEKLRKVVSQWDPEYQRWNMVESLMDPKDVASFRRDQERVRSVRGKKVYNSDSRREEHIRRVCRKNKVSSDVLKIYGQQYLEERGGKIIRMKPFLEWLEKKGIPKDWTIGSGRGVQQVAAAEAKPKNDIAAKLAALGIKPVPVSKESGGEVSSTSERKSDVVSPTDFGRWLALQRKSEQAG